jgi:hypothetical protein
MFHMHTHTLTHAYKLPSKQELDGGCVLLFHTHTHTYTHTTQLTFPNRNWMEDACSSSALMSAKVHFPVSASRHVTISVNTDLPECV